jgi:hypothetical protein
MNGPKLPSSSEIELSTFEENAVMTAYEIHVGAPKTHEKRSVPYPERLAPTIEQACAGKGPEGLLFGDGVNQCATRARVAYVNCSSRDRTACAARIGGDHPG